MKPDRYPLMEHFYTVQGEGANTGRSAYFLRLGGCDVGCVWCDVKDSWEANRHPLCTIDRMVEHVNASGAKRVVVTGGEPCMYDLQPLTDALHKSGLSCYLETSGAYPVSGTWDWICVSPKKFKAPLPDSLQKADELKVVVYHPSDLEWAEKHAAGVAKECRLFLQPEYDVRDRMLPLIIDYAKRHQQWTISLQTHKVMQIP
jgi:organic radical activating enzyme